MSIQWCCDVFMVLAKAEKVDYFPAANKWGLIWKIDEQNLQVVPITHCPFCGAKLQLLREEPTVMPVPMPPA